MPNVILIRDFSSGSNFFLVSNGHYLLRKLQLSYLRNNSFSCTEHVFPLNQYGIWGKIDEKHGEKRESLYCISEIFGT
jgi:hypothetical protein